MYIQLHLILVINILQEFVPDWGVSTSESWTILERMVELFLPTTVVISSLEGEKYVTQSLILLQLCHLENSVQAVKQKCMLFD